MCAPVPSCCRVPQLADCTDVMTQIKRRKGTRYTCLTPNIKVGAALSSSSASVCLRVCWGTDPQAAAARRIAAVLCRTCQIVLAACQPATPIPVLLLLLLLLPVFPCAGL